MSSFSIYIHLFTHIHTCSVCVWGGRYVWYACEDGQLDGRVASGGHTEASPLATKKSTKSIDDVFSLQKLDYYLQHTHTYTPV
jgi:hypothetical protein